MDLPEEGLSFRYMVFTDPHSGAALQKYVLCRDEITFLTDDRHDFLALMDTEAYRNAITKLHGARNEVVEQIAGGQGKGKWWLSVEAPPELNDSIVEF